MSSDDANRLAYLDALGIDVWVPRAPDAPDAGAGSDADCVTAGAGADPDGWSELRAAVASCTRCPLHESRTQTVFGVGNPDADWLIIGEAPGGEEDRQGEPFVGRAGKLLDEMLRSIGQSRDKVFITNILKCRPPKNRDPHQDEADTCRPYLKQQIQLIRPRIILAVGRIAAQQLLRSDEPVGRLRGRLHRVDGIPLVVTYHPAYLLRSPAQKAKSWRDLCFARQTEREEGA